MLSFLGSEIGRGHPFYLDGVRRALTAAGLDDRVARETDVFAVSRGRSRLAWRSVLAAYRIAGRGGMVSAAYHRLRGGVDYDRGGRLLEVLGRDLRAWAAEAGADGGADGARIVVDHPAVVGALGGADANDVWYVHGEMVAPPEAMVRGAAGILVPTEEVAAEFRKGGVAADRLHVTGICIENELLAGAAPAAQARRDRLATSGSRTVGCFSSGAEPPSHVETLVEAAVAARRGGHDVVVVARAGGRLARAARGEIQTWSDGSALLEFESRLELDRITAGVIERLDVVVSPPHERSNWALGLGIPFFLVGPDIGPFAPRNRALLLRAGVAMELHTPTAAAGLAGLLEELHDRGLLVRMAENGFGAPIDGFPRAARILAGEDADA